MYLPSLQDIYVTSKLILQAARHTELLEAFSSRQLGSIAEDLMNERSEELSLILEVVDILDELNTLMLLLEKQLDVIRDLRSNYLSTKKQNTLRRHGSDPEHSTRIHLGYAGDLMEQALDRLQSKKADMERLHGEVTQTHKLVSCPGPESVMVRRVTHYVANRSWNCWT